MSAPGQCAAVLIQREDGAVLALRQSYGLGFWDWVGGVVEADETSQQAAVREAARSGSGCEADRYCRHLHPAGRWVAGYLRVCVSR
ncbi:NUDIX hydrolase [Deinococcus sp. Marseille-Q6407]|uniref:NUDIX hydrolase n=1 Tax=Deinococcus sp. Marseille-Q6407 TaxID=2969223 RepID=UPI00396568C3